MIIKSHIRGGYRAAASYLKAVGQNEKVRTVRIGDPDVSDLDTAFQKMWEVASTTKAKKPLHHISINPRKDERLTDEQVFKIVSRCESKFGYKEGEHQHVIVEHIRDGRQHFHVVWNRVPMSENRAVWPGLHWNKSKEAAREMEAELGLKRPVPRKMKRIKTAAAVLITVPSGQRPKLRGSTFETPSLSRRRPALPEPSAKGRSFSSFGPASGKKRWPTAAVIDWEVWGHRSPPHFFAKWPELAPDGFVPRTRRP